MTTTIEHAQILEGHALLARKYGCTTDAVELNQAAQRLRELDRKVSIADALNDSAYISGAQAGFNCALSDDVEALNKLIASRNGYLKPLSLGAVKEST